MAKYNDVMENIKVTDEMRSRILRNVALSLEAGTDTESEAENEAEDVTETATEAEKGYAAEKEAEKIAEFPKTKKKFNGAWIPPVALTAAAVILIVVRPWSGSSLMSKSESAMTADTTVTTDSAAEAAYEDYYDYEDVAEAATESEESYKYTEEAEYDVNEEESDGMIFDAQEYASAGEMSDAVGFEIKDITTVPFEPDEVIYRVITGTLAEIMYIGDDEKLTFRKSAGLEDNSGDYNNYSIAEALEIEGAKVNILGYDEGFYLATWYDGEYFYSVGSQNPLPTETMEEIVRNVVTGN